MNARTLISYSDDYEYTIFKFTDGGLLTADKLDYVDEETVLVNGVTLVNLQAVKTASLAEDEEQAGRFQRS